MGYWCWFGPGAVLISLLGFAGVGAAVFSFFGDAGVGVAVFISLLLFAAVMAAVEKKKFQL